MEKKNGILFFLGLSLMIVSVVIIGVVIFFNPNLIVSRNALGIILGISLVCGIGMTSYADNKRGSNNAVRQTRSMSFLEQLQKYFSHATLYKNGMRKDIQIAFSRENKRYPGASFDSPILLMKMYCTKDDSFLISVKVENLSNSPDPMNCEEWGGDFAETINRYMSHVEIRSHEVKPSKQYKMIASKLFSHPGDEDTYYMLSFIAYNESAVDFYIEFPRSIIAAGLMI